MFIIIKINVKLPKNIFINNRIKKLQITELQLIKL